MAVSISRDAVADQSLLWLPIVASSLLRSTGTSPCAKTFTNHHHQPHIDFHIVTMPGIAMDDLTADICETVHRLKVERDTWEAVALKYKAAFETQTSRLKELQNLCFATQAELENERAQHHRSQTMSDSTQCHRPSTINGAEDLKDFGTATILTRDSTVNSLRPRTWDECINPLFGKVQQYMDQNNHGAATGEIERLLRGPLSPKARAEGLLLKSSILKAAGPDELYDALAACSEALELCDRISDLESFLPRIQYQRGLLYYQLRMVHQARDAFAAVNPGHVLFTSANEYRTSCNEEIRIQRAANRRSGFDEYRTFDEGMVVQLNDKIKVSLRDSIAALYRTNCCLDSVSPHKCAVASSSCRKVQTHVAPAPMGQWQA
jgi:hypothetical protein